jgi:2-amino-4-hydroxy-6-hydroxymethyldihydropteridine diphosphokinase
MSVWSSSVESAGDMTRVFVGVGSNIDRERSIRAGVAELGARFGTLDLSPVYENPAVGFTGGSFYNLVAAFETELSPAAVDGVLHDIEERHGRRREAASFAPRTLDLDLLLYGDLVDRQGAPRLPRDDIDRYAFVLRPLADIAGNMRHPVTGRTFRQMWTEFRDRGELKRIDFDWNGLEPGRKNA